MKSSHTLWAAVTGMAMSATAFGGSITLWVDDDGPSDPAPGNPAISDPLEDGSAAHPFDSIQEALDVAVDDDEIIVKAGTYTELVDLNGLEVLLRSESGPQVTIISGQNLQNSVITADSGETLSTIVDGFTIRDGIGRSTGLRRIGGGMVCLGSDPAIRNCIFRNNTATEGAGLFTQAGQPQIANSMFYANISTGGARGGGAIYSEIANPIITSTTIVGNMSNGGGACYAIDGSPRFINCVMWDNTPNQIQTEDGGAAIISYSNVQGGFAGTGNINFAPNFVDQGAGDLRPAPTSPLIDRGDSTAVAAVLFTDLAGGARGVDDPNSPERGVAVFGLTIDMGAYEYQVGCAPETTCLGDVDGAAGVPDGQIDFFDLIRILSGWGPCP